MNYNLLNEMINYIEKNLTEDINYKALAKIVGISDYSLQRIFVFLTGISISEYIRKRRLSKAFEELKTTDTKIIDLAIKYKYDSPISFSRAFKLYFHMTPTECKKNKKNYKLFPIIKFNNNSINSEVNYEIKDIEEKVLYCFETKAKLYDDFLFKIRELYEKINHNDIYAKFNKVGMYGISTFENNEYTYYVGSELKLDNTKKIIIEKGKYAVFEAGTNHQDDIVRVYDFVYNTWIISTNYEIMDKPEIELYDDNNCFIYFKIKDKQN